jgi:hypothetical protein
MYSSGVFATVAWICMDCCDLMGADMQCAFSVHGFHITELYLDIWQLWVQALQ